METTTQRITSELRIINTEINDFLDKYSGLKPVNNPNDTFVIISPDGDHYFNDLLAEAVPIQNQLFKRFNLISNIIQVLLNESISDHIEAFSNYRDRVLVAISQNRKTISRNILQEKEVVSNTITKLITLLNSLFPDSNQIPIFIPDTNALYANTSIESWAFRDANKFTIALTPSVLSDLDRHKIEHRNQDVRDKATLLIRKIKEYRRRGKLTEGVTIKNDAIRLFSIATEPDFKKTLPWLDSNNDDDRLIAETLEIIRKYSAHAVILVTADINLQNKCEVANLVYFEPPIQPIAN